MGQRIAGSASAYLRQHAHQPVDWWPYSDEAFAEAAARDVPVFLSIGYAACHWCHVMARESFDDPGIAAYLNEHFVPIKIDREEHPAVDQIYMAATQTLTGAGGWPMSVFTLPDGRTIHAGTYFPPVPRPGTPSFGQVLEAVNDAWVNRRPQLVQQATALADHLGSVAAGQAKMFSRSLPLPVSSDEPLLAPVVAAAVDRLAALEDPTGGFAPAPKFPPSAVLDFLLRAGLGPGPSAVRGTELAARTLGTMARGALADHVGGGFARYCVDAGWKIPHFEKMLYDNAQLLGVYARAGVQLPEAQDRELARRSAAGIGAWLEREMLLPGGGFASSLDADTVMPDGIHREGATYTFSRTEAAALVPDRGNIFWALWDGRAAEEPGPEEPQLTIALSRTPAPGEWAALDAAFAALGEARSLRIQPSRDEKVVAGWNGLMVQSLAEASALLDDPALLRLAGDAADYLWSTHWDAAGRSLRRVSYRGQANTAIAGVLEDYAGVALGFQALAVCGGEPAWIGRANAVLRAALEKFLPGGQPFDAPDDDPRVLASRAGARTAEALDDAVPSATSLLASALLNRAGLAQLAGTDPYDAGIESDLDLVRRLVGFVPAIADKAPHAAGSALGVATRFVHSSSAELAVAGGTPAERRSAMRLGILAGVSQWGEMPRPGSASTGYPPGPGGALRLYVCRGGVCHAPVGDLQSLASLLLPGLVQAALDA
ncbi:thioredoxin domain-containing protein [Paeniglutamicibacter sp. NPDC091659]|uniref:thioredoxin domain-containing protein n=1 Tax=Paeniglutamicibacter sp. NPDC091659 TaxID=3364389 RepID=UPI0038192587